MIDLNFKLKKLDSKIDMILNEPSELDFWYYLRVRLAMQNWGDVSEKVKLTNISKLKVIIKLFYISICNLWHVRKSRRSNASFSLYSTSTSCFFSEDSEISFIDAFSPCGEKQNNTVYLIHSGNLLNINLLNWLSKRKDVIFDNVLVKYSSFIFSLLSYHFDKFFSKKKCIDYKSEEIASLLHDTGFSMSARNIELLYRRFLIEKSSYQLLLKSLRMSSVDTSFVVSAYTKVSLVGALKSLNLDVTEYQHGICGLNHFGYDLGELITRRKVRERVMPDKFLAYNEYWQSSMEGCGQYKNGVEISPYKKLQRAKKYGKLPNFLLKKDFIVFTGGFNDDQSSLQFCKDAHEELEKLNVILIFRPHPKDSIEKYEETFKNYGNIHVFSDFTILTETLLCHCLAHVSVYSACHFDAVDVVGCTYVLHSENDKSELEQHIVKRPDLFIRIHDGLSFVSHLSTN